MKITMVVFKVLFLGALFIISNNNLYLSDVNDREEFYGMYLSWINTLISESAEFTAYFLKSEWLPGMNEVSVDTIEG